MKRITLMLFALLIAMPALALDYDQNVTPDVIFGSGNANGHFTVFTSSNPSGDTLELGLRGKVRFDENGLPDNIFNELAPGEYYFLAGVGTGQSGITPTWAFEWTVNTDVTGTGAFKVGDFTYELGLDFDPGPGTNFVVFDPITPTVDTPLWDHAMGDNSTANGGGVSATTEAEYLTYLSQYNVAQQSWRYSWFDAFNTFDPSEVGIYDIYFRAIGPNGNTDKQTNIQVHVGYGDPVASEDASWGNVKALFR